MDVLILKLNWPLLRATYAIILQKAIMDNETAKCEPDKIGTHDLSNVSPWPRR